MGIDCRDRGIDCRAVSPLDGETCRARGVRLSRCTRETCRVRGIDCRALSSPWVCVGGETGWTRSARHPVSPPTHTQRGKTSSTVSPPNSTVSPRNSTVSLRNSTVSPSRGEPTRQSHHRTRQSHPTTRQSHSATRQSHRPGVRQSSSTAAYSLKINTMVVFVLRSIVYFFPKSQNRRFFPGLSRVLEGAVGQYSES